MLDQENRLLLSKNPALGGGNAWRTALETSPSPELTCLVADRPLSNADGADQFEFNLAQLNELADSWSAFYLDRGVRPRDRVVVYIDDAFEDQLQLAALAQIGAIPLLINGNVDPDLALGLMAKTTPVGLYTDDAHLPLLAGRQHELPGLSWTITGDQASPLGRRTLPEHGRYRHAEDDPVFLCHSSGTTGAPKPIIWTHRQSVAGPRWRLTQPEAPGTVLFTAVPQSHSAAIAYTFYTLLTGMPLIAYSDPSAQGVARGARKYRPTRIMAFNQTFSALATAEPDPEDFTSVQEWQNTGDSAHDAHIRTLIRYGRRSIDGVEQPGSMFSDGLGSSELGWAALRRNITAESPSRPRHLGSPVPAMDVAVLREDGTEAADGEVGRLGVRGPSNIPGYWNDHDTFYGSKLAGYWLSGDLVRRDGDDIFHLDRAVDTIRTPLGDGYSVLMEEVLLTHLPEITDCAVAAGGSGGSATPVAVVRTSRDVDPGELLRRANTALHEARQPGLALLEIAGAEADIPVGATGKVLKRKLRDKYADIDAFATTASPQAVATTEQRGTAVR